MDLGLGPGSGTVTGRFGLSVPIRNQGQGYGGRSKIRTRTPTMPHGVCRGHTDGVKGLVGHVHVGGQESIPGVPTGEGGVGIGVGTRGRAMHGWRAWGPFVGLGVDAVVVHTARLAFGLWLGVVLGFVLGLYRFRDVTVRVRVRVS